MQCEIRWDLNIKLSQTHFCLCLRSASLPVPVPTRSVEESFNMSDESAGPSLGVARKKKIAIGVIFMLSPNPEENSRFQDFFFSHFPLFESHMNKLKSAIEQVNVVWLIFKMPCFYILIFLTDDVGDYCISGAAWTEATYALCCRKEQSCCQIDWSMVMPCISVVLFTGVCSWHCKTSGLFPVLTPPSSLLPLPTIAPYKFLSSTAWVPNI